MTYLFVNNQEIKNDLGNPIPVTYGAAGVSAFDEPIAVPITPVIQIDALYGLIPREFEVFEANGGTAETTNTLMKVHTGTAPGGYGVIRSRRILRYRPGQGALGRFTAGFSTPHANTTQRAGFFAQEQSITIGYDGTQFGILRQNGGKAVIYKLTITTPAAGTETATITLNGVAYTVSISSTNSNTNATSIANRVGGYPGWVVEQVDNTVFFLSQSVGPQAGSFLFSSTGAAQGTMASVQAGVANTLDWTYQQDFNIDTLDGTGPSGMVLDPSKLNIYQISFRWLGAGQIQFAIENHDDGNIIAFHHIHYANRHEDVHLDNPSFKLGYIAANLTGSAATDVHTYGASMLGAVEGLRVSTNYTTSTSSAKTSLTNNTLHHLLTVRNQLIANNKINLREFIARQLSIAVQANDPVEVVLILNGVMNTGRTYTTINSDGGSAIQSTTTGTFTSPVPIATYVVPINGSGTFDLSDLGIVVPSGNELSVAVRSGQTIQSVLVGLTWEEN